MATNKDVVNSSFRGLQYISSLFSFLENSFLSDKTKLIFSPKFIFRGESKVYTDKYGALTDYCSQLKSLGLWREKAQKTYDLFQSKTIEFINKGFDDNTPEEIRNCIINKSGITYNTLLIPAEIRSGASIRLRSNTKKGDDLSVASYLHYIRTLISDIKASYPQFSNMNDLDVLAEIQHKGGASCLVDFSNNFLVALWFATQKDLDDFGYIYCLDINAESLRNDTFSFITDRHINSSIEDILLSTRKSTNFVGQKSHKFWVWKPSNINSRIARQDSVFVFGLEPFRIEDHDIYVIPIPPSWKVPIQSALKSFFGLTAETIYPDSDGFATSHDKINSIANPTNYFNPRVLNGKFKAYDELQKGLSFLLKGHYELALRLLMTFESQNRKKICRHQQTKAINSFAFETAAVLLELKYSIALCYRRLDRNYNAALYFKEALDLIKPILDQLYHCRLEPKLYKTNMIEEFEAKDKYIHNKLLKILNDYIDLCLHTGNYSEAINIIHTNRIYISEEVSPLINIRLEHITILMELSYMQNNCENQIVDDILAFHDIDILPSYKSLHYYFMIIHECIKMDKEYFEKRNKVSIKKVLSKVDNLIEELNRTLEEVKDIENPQFIQLELTDVQKAYTEYYKPSLDIISFLDDLTNKLKSAFNIAQGRNVLSAYNIIT